MTARDAFINDLCERTKKCTKCGNVLPFTTEFFYRLKREVTGLHMNCKACMQESKRLREERRAMLARPWPPYQRWAKFEVIG